MNHTIEVLIDWTIDLATSPRQPLERLQVRKGTRFKVQLRPYVIETPDGLFEVADLFFDDGSTSYSQPFAMFRFVD
jgi:hypothetical protein